MIIDERQWLKLMWAFKIFNWQYESTDTVDKDLVKQMKSFIDDIAKNNSKKIYVITNNAIIDDEIDYSIYGVATTEKEAKRIFKQAVKYAKMDADFENLGAINIENEVYLDEDKWYYSETDHSFELYLNGEYNSNNFSIQIKEYDLISEDSLEYNETEDFLNKNKEELCL